MRILYVVHQYPPTHIGGTEIYTQAVARRLARRGHETTVWYRRSAPGLGWNQRKEDGVSVVEAWAGTLSPARRFCAVYRDNAVLAAFECALDRTRPQVVHIQHLIGLPAGVVRSCLERGIPFVLTLHDYWWVCANAQLLTNYSHELCAGPVGFLNCARCALARGGAGGQWLGVPPIAALLAWRARKLRNVIAHAAALIAPSGFVATWYGSRGVPDRKIVLLPHGLEWPPDLDRAQERAGPIKLAYIGGLAWQKGVHVLVDSLRGLEDDAQLIVAGDETFDKEYVARLRSDAPANVRFLGPLPRERVWQLLSQVDAVAVPSLWNETFSLLLHEAYAAGLPVLASRLGALTEAVCHEHSGLLLPPGRVAAWQSAILRLANEPGLLATLRAGVNAPMTLDEHASHLESIYSQCQSMVGG